jgi:glyoxylase-like metal-dependent hydrolase (beta-lactamase superfamily II)
MAVSAVHEATKGQPVIHSSFERATSTWQYVVADPTTSAAVIIDSVLDFNSTTLQLSTSSADALLALVDEHRYRVEMILETHAHADHVTAAAYLQKRLAQTQGLTPKIGIGRRIQQVQKFFGDRYQISPSEYEHAFDHLFEDNERFQLGALQVEVLHLPGHTPDHVGYLIGGE